MSETLTFEIPNTMRYCPVTLPTLRQACAFLPQELTPEEFQAFVDAVNSWRDGLLAEKEST